MPCLTRCRLANLQQGPTFVGLGEGNRSVDGKASNQIESILTDVSNPITNAIPFIITHPRENIVSELYSAPHSRVAQENVGLQKEQNYNTFAYHTCNEVRLCVCWEFAKRKLATRKDKIKIIKSFPLALSVSGEERCEVLACFHVVVKMYRYSLEERVLIV
jgi:hypothetical protein